MATPNFLVIGANRGIGLNILKSFIRRSWHVTGTIRPQIRDYSSINELKETGATILEMDYLDENTIKQTASAYGERPLDILISVGGLPPSPKPWHEQTNDDMTETFRVMALGPFLAIKHFLPKLDLAAEPKIVNISSAFGSISGKSLPISAGSILINEFTENTTLSAPARRFEQPKLMSVTLAREWEKVGRNATIVCMEPGFLSTRLTGFDGEDDMETCIAGIVKVIDSIDTKDNGAFLKWDGTTIPY